MQKYEIQNTRFTSATCLIHHRAQSPPTDCCSAFFKPLRVRCRCNWCCAPFSCDVNTRTCMHTRTHRKTQKDRRAQYAGYGILSGIFWWAKGHTDHQNQPVNESAAHHDNLNSKTNVSANVAHHTLSASERPEYRCWILIFLDQTDFFGIKLMLFLVLELGRER